MSNSGEEPDIIKWFRREYPLESYLSNEIAVQVGQIFNQIRSNLEQIPLDMYAIKNEKGTMDIAGRDMSIIFFGTLSRIIIDIISKNSESTITQNLNKMIDEKAKEAVKNYMTRATPMIVLQDFKRCPSCGLDNDYKNKHCSECGTKLPEK